MKKLCYLVDIAPGSSLGFSALGIFAVRSPDGFAVYLYRNLCPHLQVPLEWQPNRFLDASGSMIECANHAALFVIENGLCVAGPCRGKRLQAIACEVRDGWIYADLA